MCLVIAHLVGYTQRCSVTSGSNKETVSGESYDYKYHFPEIMAIKIDFKTKF